MLNSVGLQNPGVEHFLEHDMPYLAKQDTVKIANIAGSSIEDYCAIAERLSESEIDMFELNISCPNVKQGGAAFGTSCESAERVVKEVRKYAKKPMIVKLSPNVTDIVSIAKAVEAQGADAVSLINTLLGMRIDINTRRPNSQKQCRRPFRPGHLPGCGADGVAGSQRGQGAGHRHGAVSRSGRTPSR